jgi:hypothetical protein
MQKRFLPHYTMGGQMNRPHNNRNHTAATTAWRNAHGARGRNAARRDTREICAREGREGRDAVG